MAGEEGVCVGFIILLGILFVLYILVKFAKLFAYVGAWRTGKALKKISKEGLVIQQPGQWPQPSYPQPSWQQHSPARQLRQDWQPAQRPTEIRTNGTKFCRHCGKAILADSKYCEHCGNAV
jgi:hypothetical protein